MRFTCEWPANGLLGNNENYYDSQFSTVARNKGKLDDAIS